MAQHKALSSAVEVKAADRGEVEAVFATYNVIDRDGDVTFPGAFTEGDRVAISPWQHEVWKGAPPVGEGTIHSRGNQAVFRGRFYLGTTAGRDHFELVKARGAAQEWSYGFDVMHKPEAVTFEGRKANALRKLKVYEVSPVFQGAGIGTATLAVKANQDGEEAAVAVTAMAYKAAIAPHETGVQKKFWNPADLVEVLTKAKVDDLRLMHAWVNPQADPTVKSSYEFLHHHGPEGPANVWACLEGMSRLKRAGACDPQIPDGDREEVYAHLAAHLIDADYDVPETFEPGLKMNDRLTLVIADARSVLTEVDEVGASRALKGKAAHTARTLENLDGLRDVARAIDLRLNSPQETAAEEFARFVYLTQNLGETA